MDIIPDLGAQIAADDDIIEYLADKEIAKDFYAALCNVEWHRVEDPSDEDLVIRRLKGQYKDYWSCSWRFAGGIIAHIRHVNYNTTEGYMDFYCSGNEGTVSPLVGDCFKRLGWNPQIRN